MRMPMVIIVPNDQIAKVRARIASPSKPFPKPFPQWHSYCRLILDKPQTNKSIPDAVVIDVGGHVIGCQSDIRQNAETQSPELNYSKPSVPLDLMIFWYAKKLSLRRRS